MGIDPDNGHKSAALHLFDAQGRRHCNNINLTDAHGAGLYQNEHGHSILPARVAVHQCLLNEAVRTSRASRGSAPNTYLAEATLYHSIACLCEETFRDNNALQLFGMHWEQLDPQRRETLLAQTIDQEAHHIRFQADIHLVKAALHWQPESTIGDLYRQSILTYAAISFAQSDDVYRKRLADELPALQTINPDALTLLHLDQTTPSSLIAPESYESLRQLISLPVSEREMGFFNYHLENTTGSHDEIIVPDWIPDNRYPPERLDAINYGKLTWHGQINQEQVSMTLDLDSRCFTRITIDKHQNIVREVFHPADTPAYEHYFAPGYTVSISQNNEDPVITSLLPGLQSSESMQCLHEEARQYATDLLTPLAANESVQQVLPAIVRDIERQRIEAHTQLLKPEATQRAEREHNIRECLISRLNEKLWKMGHTDSAISNLLEKAVQKCLDCNANTVMFAGYDAERKQIVIQTDVSQQPVICETLTPDRQTEPHDPKTSHELEPVLPQTGIAR